MEKQIFFKKLDALRFIAFLLVFWQHGFSDVLKSLINDKPFLNVFLPLILTGGIGVHIFFVISGFLITFLMLKEEETNGRFNLRFFYIRRILRIWPLYYLVIILGLYVLPHINNMFHTSGKELMNVAFLNNFAMGVSPPNINIAWSVAIEEQFYLFWPLLFILFRNKQLLSLVCISLFIMSTFYTLECLDSYSDTLPNIRYLMVGCWGGIFYFKHKNRISESFLMQNPSFYYILILGIFLTITKDFYGSYLKISYLLLPLFYLYLVIFSINRSKENTKDSVFSKLGKYTYGMYMYHPMIMIFVEIFLITLKIDRNEGIWRFVFPLISLFLTIGFSVLSYEFFEKHILKLKSKFSFIKTRI